MPTTHGTTEQITMFGVELDAICLESAVNRLSEWTLSDANECRYVVTPNVDHLVLLQHNQQLQAAYRDAAMVVADGLPLVLASRLFRKPLPERVAGSDLVPAMLARKIPNRPLRVYLLGAAAGVAERAAERIQTEWSHVQVVGTYSPPLGFEHDTNENERILDRIAEADVDLLVIGLGAPKQELWIHQHRKQTKAKVALCAGATIDFLAGERRRAPIWVQRVGLEWCFRMLTDPKRLVRRYAYDAWIFPQLLWREMTRREMTGQPVA